MSQRWDQVEERLDEYESQLDTVYRLYHIPVLAALMAFMLWVRVRHYERYVTEGGILLGGNDAWYHYRTTNYAVRNFPWNLPFDPWTGFDAGQRTGQFGTLFDQLIAFAALVVGLGDPSQSTVDMTFLLAPAVFGALCAVPVFYIGKRLGGKFGGIVAVLVLAMTPGAFLSRSVAGFTDHHVAETLFQAISLLAVMVMVTVAQREKPIYELVEARDLDALRRPALWGAVAGVAVSLHIWVWPPAVFFVGVFALFLFVVLSLEYVRGHSPDHLAIPSVVAMLVVVVLTGVKIATWELRATDFSIVQPLLALLVALGAAFMAGLARVWDGTDLPRVGYPAAVAGTGVVLAGLVALVSPGTFEFFLNQLTRVAGLTATDTARTVGEISSPWSVADGPVDFFSQSYMLAFYTAIAGFGLLVYRNLVAERPRAEQILVVVWSAFMLLATMTQVRFDYYFVIAVAAANAYLVREIYRFVDLDDVRRDVTNVQAYQVLIVVAILFVVAGPLLVTGATVDAADSSSNPGESRLWADSLEWMNENTPAPGAYGSGDDPRLEYYGAYENTEDFEYEDGEYGVMAWWDYGHFITTGARRIPVANPFQQHASEAADFLLSGDEEQALEILDEDNGEGSGVQYVMVDYQLAQMGTGKYTAPAAWETRHGFERVRARGLEEELNSQGEISLYPDLATLVYVPDSSGDGYQQGWLDSQRAYESMRVQLYRHHGSAIEASTRVYRFEQYSPEEGWGVVADVEEYDSPEAASEAAANDSNAVHGGVQGPGERVEALQHFRLVYASEAPTDNPQSWVKTFERVEGATIEGTGPPNTEVQTSVEMVSEATGQRFFYNQYAETDEDGNFEMVVPYSTTGYDEYGVEEGYTDVDVRANGSYQFLAVEDGTAVWTGETEVTEGQVLGEDDAPAQVELEPDDGGEEAAGGDEETTDDETADGEETDDADATNDTDDGTGENTTDDTDGNTSDDATDGESDGQQRRAARSP